MRIDNVIVATLCMWLALSASAAAEDFTFVVPVRIANVPPEISTVHVGCHVSNRLATPGREPLGILGNGHVFAPVSGGAFSGDVTVSFNANVREYAGFADHYGCAIVDLGRGPRDHTGRVYYPGAADFIPIDRAAAYVVRTDELPLR